MKWSPQQAKALDGVGEWLKNGGPQVFRLFGYAGTGKTTLARHLTDNAGQVRFAAYTGKAAHVLHQNGCADASTIHSLIYIPKEKSAEKLRALQTKFTTMEEDNPKREELAKQIRAEKENLKRPSFVLNTDSVLNETDLLVIDECSMVDDRMGEDLLSFGCKVLVLGDPAQLPPVRGGGYFTEHQPDIMLTEIHRQAADNPIIALATMIRQGDAPEQGRYGDSVVTNKLTPEIALEANQLIVGRNATRHATNRRMRDLMGFSGIIPNKNERLVCLRNNHDIGILNGSLWIVNEVYNNDDPLCMSISPETGPEIFHGWQEVMVHRAPFEGQEVDWWLRRDAEEFCYGYALTCHKAQGSQWDSVVVIDESAAFRQHSQRWLYTAITRAAKKVVIRI